MMVKKIAAGLFVSYLLIVGFISYLKEDVTFSEQENRYLAQKPSFSIQKVLSGKFMKEIETYLADQFIGKNQWIAMKTKAEQFLLKKEINGIYLGKDGFLFERIGKQQDQLEKNMNFVKTFAKTNPQYSITLLLAPTSAAIYPEKLPLFAPSYPQEELIKEIEQYVSSEIQVVNALPSLMNQKEEYIYFRTDHHWTMRGAYYAYQELSQLLQYTPYPLSEFHIDVISKDFLGSYSSKTIGYSIEPDLIELFTPTFPMNYEVTFHDHKEVSFSLYNVEYLKKKDQYSFFLNGHHPLLTIRSSAHNGKKIAVIKDSFAHVFIPFLVNHFEEVHVIDLRYFRIGLNQYLEENEISNILLLFNVKQFMTDPNLHWLHS